LIYWTLTERFGWTLEYAKSISVEDLKVLNVIDEARLAAR
jgi:hypothetical protein